MSGAASLAEGEPEGALTWRDTDQCPVVSKQICCTIGTLVTPNTGAYNTQYSDRL